MQSPHPSRTPSDVRVLVIGVGNAACGDDAVGLVVARHLRHSCPEGVRVVEASGEATQLLDTWQNMDASILIDAVCSGAAPGTIYRVDPCSEPMPQAAFACSTHTLGVAEAIGLAQALQQLPRHLVVYGIEGKRFELGAGLSAEIAHVVPEVVRRVQADIRILQTERRQKERGRS